MCLFLVASWFCLHCGTHSCPPRRNLAITCTCTCDSMTPMPRFLLSVAGCRLAETFSRGALMGAQERLRQQQSRPLSVELSPVHICSKYLNASGHLEDLGVGHHERVGTGNVQVALVEFPEAAACQLRLVPPVHLRIKVPPDFNSADGIQWQLMTSACTHAGLRALQLERHSRDDVACCVSTAKPSDCLRQGRHLRDVVPLDVGDAVERDVARKWHRQVVPASGQLSKRVQLRTRAWRLLNQIKTRRHGSWPASQAKPGTTNSRSRCPLVGQVVDELARPQNPALLLCERCIGAGWWAHRRLRISPPWSARS